MRRFLVITASVVVALIGFLILALLVLTQTPVGIKLADRYARPLIEEAVREQLGSEISFAPLAGKLPSRIILRDVVLTQEGEVWLTADSFVLEWSPLDIIGGQVDVSALILADAALYRVPNIPERPEEEKPEEEQGSFELPDIRLNDVVVDSFVIGEEVLGRRYSVSLLAAGRYAHPEIAAQVLLETDDGTDRITVDLVFDGREVDGQLSLLSRENGVVTELIGGDAETTLGINATGPLDDLDAEFTGEAGAYGRAEGGVAASLQALDEVAVQVTYRPGTIIPEDIRAALGDAVELGGLIVYREERLNVDVASLRGAFGAIEGTVDASFADRLYAAVDLSGALEAKALEPFGAAAFAGPVTLNANAAEVGDGYNIAGRVAAGGLRVTITDAISRGDMLFQGQVQVDAAGYQIGDERLDPLLKERAEALTQLGYTEDGLVTFEGLSVTVGGANTGQLRLRGSGRFDTATEALRTQLRAEASAQALARLAGRGEYQGPLTATLTANGSLSDLSAELAASIPALTIEGTSFGAGKLAASASGLPDAPEGSLLLTSTDDSYGADASFSFRDNRLTVPEAVFRAAGLVAEANATVDLNSYETSADLSIDTPGRTILPTGQVVDGSMEATIRVGADLAFFDVDVDGQQLRLDDNEIEALAIRAEGPKDAVAFDVTASDVTVSDTYLAEIEAGGTADLGEGQTAAIDRLMLSLSGAEDDAITLAAPTTVSWGDAIELAPTRLLFPRTGEASLSGRFGDDRWQGSLEANALEVPGSTARADLTAELDTSAEIPATFEATLSTRTEEATYAVRADGTWDGRQVSGEALILENGDKRLGSVTVSMPVRLVRQPSITVDVPSEGFDIRILYDDRIAPLLAFIPSDTRPVEGLLDADVHVFGSFDALQTEGRVEIAEGRFEETETGITLQDLTGGIRFSVTPDGTSGTLDITGADAAGRQNAVKVTGLVRTTADDSTIDIAIRTQKAQLANTNELKLQATTDLSLTGDFQEVTLAGGVRIDQLDFEIPGATATSNGPTLTPINLVRTDGDLEGRAGSIGGETSTPLVINLDLAIDATRGIFVSGRGLRSEWNADVTVEGTAEKPIIGGVVRLVSGDLLLGGRQFDLTEGIVRFQRREEIDPLLSVRAETQAGEGTSSVTAIVSISGSASSPDISFTSSPSLPEEDVLALVLFGRPANDLGAAEALQLASAAATLSGGGLLGGGGGIRAGLGLDRLSYDAGANALTVGKYVSEDIYVSARQSIGEIGTVISVVYELSRFFNVETTLQPDGAQTIGANYKRDY